MYISDKEGQNNGHGFDHIDRVRRWALFFAKKENFKNLEIVTIASLLHDIAYSLCRNNNLHGEIGARMAKKYLKENSNYTINEIIEICNAIQFHNSNRKGKGKLLYILRDADMMDMFGPIGIMRAFISHSHKPVYNQKNIKGETWGFKAVDFDNRFDSGIGIGSYIVDHINFQISCYDNLKSKIARKIALPLVNYMKGFLISLERQVNSGGKK